MDVDMDVDVDVDHHTHTRTFLVKQGLGHHFEMISNDTIFGASGVDQ